MGIENPSGKYKNIAYDGISRAEKCIVAFFGRFFPLKESKFISNSFSRFWTNFRCGVVNFWGMQEIVERLWKRLSHAHT